MIYPKLYLSTQDPRFNALRENPEDLYWLVESVNHEPRLLHLLFSNTFKQTSGPGCSKLMTSLVNETLKFQTLIHVSQICQYFLMKKYEKLLQCKSFSHFFNKNISVFDYKVVKHLMSRPLNELVKLTML